MTTTPSLRSRVLALEPGECITVKVDEYSPGTVRNYASGLGYLLLRVFSVTEDRYARTTTITRLQ